MKSLKSKNIMKRICTADDVLRELGAQDDEVIIYRKLITVLDPSCHTVNYQLAVMIAKVLNEGWVPDWSNSSEYKYCPWFEMEGSSGFRFLGDGDWSAISAVGSRLCFKTSQLGEHAGKQFLDVYKNFMVIN